MGAQVREASPAGEGGIDRGERGQLATVPTRYGVEMWKVFVSSAVDGEALQVLGAGGERVDKPGRRLESRHAVATLDERERLAPPACTAYEDVRRRLRKEALDRLFLPGKQVGAERRCVAVDRSESPRRRCR